MPNQADLISRPLIIFILILCSILFASNHIGAHIAFDNGAGLLFAILARGIASLIFMGLIITFRKTSLLIPRPLIKWQVLLGGLIAAQSLCLYSAITLIPVPMALLLVNTWSMMFIVLSWIKGKRQPDGFTFLILISILFGLFLVLNIDFSIDINTSWLTGVALGLIAAVLLMFTMWITQYQLASIPGAVRSSYTMIGVIVCMCVLGALGAFPNGMNLPLNSEGWLGVMVLSISYGIAFTLLFVLAPKLDMGRNSPILNFEPVASLFLSYVFLGQFLNATQLVGGGIVVAGIVAIGVMKKR